ncbi:MAG: MFS transporter [Pseudomonadales bacterium]
MPTPWYHGWNVLAVSMLFQAVTFGIGIYSFTFWIEPLVAEFSVGRSRVLLIFVGLQLTLGLLSPLAGRAMDQLSMRGLIIAGACCLAVSLALTSVTQQIWQIQFLFATFMVGGLLLAGPLAAQTLAARWFNRNRGLALGLVTVGTSIGGFVLPIVFTQLLDAVGWREASLWLAGLVLLSVVPLVWLVIRNSPAAAGLSAEAAAPTAQPVAADADWTTAQLLRSPTFWMIVCAFVPLAIAFGGAQQNLGPYASDQAISAKNGAYLVSALSLTMIVAKVFFGSLSDRVDHRWLFLVAILVCFAALVQMAGPLSFLRLMLVASLLGAAAGGFLPLLGAIISTRFGTLAFGRVMGLVGPFTMLAAVGPWWAARVRDQAGSYDPAWPLLAALLIPAAIAIWFLPSAEKTRLRNAAAGA